MLHSLQTKESVDVYSCTWGLFTVFCVQLYRLHQAKDPCYMIHFMPQQEVSLKVAEVYCECKSRWPCTIKLFTELARAMWLPENDKYFQHISKNQLNEVTI
jgi:hypothetical protein